MHFKHFINRKYKLLKTPKLSHTNNTKRMNSKSNVEHNPIENTPSNPLSPSSSTQKCPKNTIEMIGTELRVQRGLVLPLVAMNLTWFAKIAITTAFLGRLGPLKLAGGALGFTFANVTGFSVLSGLCGAMEPICGQAYGAKNYKLLRKTLVMTTFMLLIATLPIALLWIHVDKILIRFGQEHDISNVAKNYLYYLLPDLIITAFLCPLKSYLSSQNITIPILLSSCFTLALHVPFNILLSKAKGLEGVAIAVWVGDLIVVVLLVLYVLMIEYKPENGLVKKGGWFEQSIRDWVKLLKLSGPCCLTTCLEWWCYEILVLLTGRLENARQNVGVLVIVLNFDYLLYSVMLSLATCASIRVSNELGASRARSAYRSACVSLAISVITGFIGGLIMVLSKGFWGTLFTKDNGILKGVKEMMLLMAIVEVVNFPLAVCGGIVRGTARPWLAMYANIGGFYLVALPLGVVLAFTAGLRLRGLLVGFLVGMIVCLALLAVFVKLINWNKEAENAQLLANNVHNAVEEDMTDRNLATVTVGDSTIFNFTNLKPSILQQGESCSIVMLHNNEQDRFVSNSSQISDSH